MVGLFGLMIPARGRGLFSLGPTPPVTGWPVCLNDALPVIAPSGVEIVTRQVPVTSAARTGATDSANNNMLNNASRSIIASPCRQVRDPTREGSQEYRRPQQPAWTPS